MTLGEKQEKFSKNVAKLFNFILENGYQIRIGECQRTVEQQKIYFKQGKSKTMNSNHLKKLAIDLFIFKNGEWFISKSQLQKIGDFWESLDKNNRWGGNFISFVDCPHFELNE